jgi:polar amino acid transport system substrate-binding protein
MAVSSSRLVYGALISGVLMVPAGPRGAHQGPADPVADARVLIAPTGTLRVGVNFGNALFTTRDPATGAPRGVGIDLVAALGQRLGVAVTHVMHATPGDVAASAGSGTWDVAILAIEPARADVVTFSSPMTEIEATYVVARGSVIGAVADVDRPGRRVAAAPRTGYELFLTRTLQQATLLRPATSEASMDLLRKGEVDAVAGLAPTLREAYDRSPDVRVLDGGFTTVNHGLAVPKGRPAGAAAAVDLFVRDMVATGALADLIARHGVQGLRAVRPAADH